MLMTLAKKAFRAGPVLFGIGFVAPLLAQSMDAASVHAPGGLTNLQFGLLFGLVWGSFAMVKGRWV